MDFIDLQGASGSSYRFRRWPEYGQHAPMAGNYAVVEPRTLKLIEVGVLENLAEAATLLACGRAKGALFTRLNVSRAHREFEDRDIAAGVAARRGR